MIVPSPESPFDRTDVRHLEWLFAPLQENDDLYSMIVACLWEPENWSKFAVLCDALDEYASGKHQDALDQWAIVYRKYVFRILMWETNLGDPIPPGWNMLNGNGRISELSSRRLYRINRPIRPLDVCALHRKHVCTVPQTITALELSNLLRPHIYRHNDVYRKTAIDHMLKLLVERIKEWESYIKISQFNRICRRVARELVPDSNVETIEELTENQE